MTESFSFTIPIRKYIDESRFTEKFSYSVPVNSDDKAKTIEAKTENKSEK